MNKKIKIAMIEKGITSLELAKILGCTSTTLSHKINGRYSFNKNEIEKLMHYFNKKYEDLF